MSRSDRLFEVVLIQILRHLMYSGQTQVGMLGGLAHPRLRQAMVAMHERPAEDWSLERLASIAGMSRSVFANAFRETGLHTRCLSPAMACCPGAIGIEARTLAQTHRRRGWLWQRIGVVEVLQGDLRTVALGMEAGAETRR